MLAYFAKSCMVSVAAGGLIAFGVSRRCIRSSAQLLDRFIARRLEQDDVVRLVLDGKTFAEGSMVLSFGILRTGEKKLP